AQYLAQEKVLWAPPDGTKTVKFAVGTHHYQHTFKIPRSCDPSFESQIGNIAYSCTVEIDKKWWRRKCKFSRHFTVTRPIDLSQHAYTLSPMVKTDDVTTK
ncbi:hypothetical protein PFISCL1PPCAC_8934, partial [Pristionchus fissidentatus]